MNIGLSLIPGLSISENLLGSIIVGVFTLSGAFLGQHLVSRREKQRRKRELDSTKDALIVELRSMEEMIVHLMYLTNDLETFKEAQYHLDDEYFDHFESDEDLVSFLLAYLSGQTWYSDTVYEANASSLGEFGSGTARALVHTHVSARNIRQNLDLVSDQLDTGQIMGDDGRSDSLSALLERFRGSDDGGGPQTAELLEKLHTATKRAVFYQKATLDYLGEDLTNTDKYQLAWAAKRVQPRKENEEMLIDGIESVIEEDFGVDVEELLDSEEIDPIQ